MKLRELIQRLEEFSENGKNDSIEVEVFETYYVGKNNTMGPYHVVRDIKKHKDKIRIVI